MTADIPLMLAPPGEPAEHVCKLHGVATTGAGGPGPGHYGYTHVWQLRGPAPAPPDLGLTAASASTDYQAAADGLDAGPARQRDGGGARTVGRRGAGDHLYDCPLFDDRLLARLTAANHAAHSPACRRHQVLQLIASRLRAVESVDDEHSV